MLLDLCARLFGFLVRDVAAECPCRRKFAEFVTDHVFVDVDRHVLPTVVHRDGQSDHVRKNHRAARPGLNRSFVVFGPGLFDLLTQVMVDERSFLN